MLSSRDWFYFCLALLHCVHVRVCGASDGLYLCVSHLQAGDSEVRDKSDNFWIILHFHQLAELIVTLQSGQQAAKLMVIIWVR